MSYIPCATSSENIYDDGHKVGDTVEVTQTVPGSGITKQFVLDFTEIETRVLTTCKPQIVDYPTSSPTGRLTAFHHRPMRRKVTPKGESWLKQYSKDCSQCGNPLRFHGPNNTCPSDMGYCPDPEKDPTRPILSCEESR